MKLEYIFAVFALIGAIDKITGNHLKLGDEFEKGIMTIGVLVLSMAGPIVLAPLLADGLSFVFAPVVKFLHIDISVVSSFFACDSGAAIMAYELSDNEALRAYNGIIVSSMFGATICPILPLALKMIEKEYHEDALTGFLCGFATIPVGCIIAGLVMKIPFGTLILNTLPTIILSAFICLGLAKKPDLTRKIFALFGEVLMIVMIAGLTIGILHQLIGKTFVPGTTPITEAIEIVGNISLILAGVFPMLAIISKVFHKPFVKLGELLKINETSVLGFLTSLANSIPMFSTIKDMDKKGRILNMAFTVSAAFALGDHLAFTLAFDNNYVLPLVLGKLLSGISALVLADVIYKKIVQKEGTINA